MEWIILDDDPFFWIDDSIVTEFKEWVHENKPECKIVLKICDSDSLTTDEWERRVGLSSKRLAPHARVLMTISFIISKTAAERLKSYDMYSTLNYRKELITKWVVEEITEKVEVSYGVYVKPGFFEAYEATKKLIPQLTKKKFARALCNYNIVEHELFHGWDNCIKR